MGKIKVYRCNECKQYESSKDFRRCPKCHRKRTCKGKRVLPIDICKKDGHTTEDPRKRCARCSQYPAQAASEKARRQA